jgi:hypothetical protein
MNGQEEDIYPEHGGGGTNNRQAGLHPTQGLKTSLPKLPPLLPIRRLR